MGKFFIRLATRAMQIALFAVSTAGAVAEDQWQIGCAVVDITPPPAMPFQVPQRPPFPVMVAAGTHDPLYAKAIVLESGGVRTAIVACDLTSIPVHIIAAARERVSQICTVPAENVMVCATHTHTGPNIRPRFFQNATPTQKAAATDYLERLPKLIADSVEQAERRLTAARLFTGIGDLPGVAFNRRFLMKDGTVQSNPAKGQDELLVNIVRPAGPTDPSVPVVYADTPDGKPLATMVSFAMHLDTTGGFQHSADYPHQLAKILADVKGPEMLTHFAMGAAGNINHYDLLDPAKPRRTKSLQEAARIGTLLAAEVVRTYERLQRLTPGPIQVSREIVRLELLEESVPTMVRQFGNQRSFHDGEMTMTQVDGRYTFEAEVMVITIGKDVAFVGLPGEMFVELGLAIKQNSPFSTTILHTLANGAIGYVPNRQAYAEGGYGASPGTTRCNPGSGEALVDSALRQLITLQAMARADGLRLNEGQEPLAR